MNKTMMKLAVAAAIFLPLSVPAAIHDFTVVMDNAQELAAVGTGPGTRAAPANGPSPAAFGAGVFRYDDVTNTFLFLSMAGSGLLGGIINQHIHLGGSGVSGGVLLGLPTPVFNSGGNFSYFAAPVPGTFPGGTNNVNEIALLAGNTYVNIHTTHDTVGEIRGQLVRVVPVPEPETYALLLAGLGLVGFAVARRRKLGM